MIGVSSGIASVLSCGDNLGIKADPDAAIDAAKAPDAALTCDCPPTEPPFAGRFRVVSNTRTIDANDTTVQSAPCPLDTLPLFGSCTTDLLNLSRNVTLRESGFFHFVPTEWFCSFRNHENVPVTIRATAVCFKRAS
jgi:hypothetical protein